MTNTPKLSLPYPEIDSTADVPRDIKALAQAIDPLGVVPIGAMMMWPVDNAPTGWLLCKGQTDVTAAAYPELASVLGTTVVGGVTIVKVPDLSGRVPLGVGAAQSPLVQGGTAHTMLEKGGEQKHILTPAQAAIRNHTHSGRSGFATPSLNHRHPAAEQAFAEWRAGDVVGNVTYGPTGNTMLNAQFTNPNTGFADLTNHQHDTTVGNPDAGESNGAEHENMPPYLAINFIVRHGH
jgi:microcystin-dependent protein